MNPTFMPSFEIQKFPFVCAAAGSLLLNMFFLEAYQGMIEGGIKTLQKNESPGSSVNVSYIETAYETIEPPVDAEFVSDKNSQADSSLAGDISSPLPEAEHKDLLTQKEQMEAARQNGEQSAQEKKNQMEQAVDQIHMDEAPQSEQVSTMDASLLPYESSAAASTEVLNDSQGKDKFPAPFISIGEKSISVQGVESFDAKGNALGVLLKKLRDNIGYQFYKMTYFNYKSGYIFTSEAHISFEITESGEIQNIQGEWIQGDPMFLKYCIAAVNEASPLEPLDKDIKPYLRDGVLTINRYIFKYMTQKEG